MNATVMNSLKAFTSIDLGLAMVYVGGAEDAPGAAVMGTLLMVGGVVLGVKAARNRLPIRAARAAFAVGIAVAAVAAFLTYRVVVAGPLFPQSQDVPSVLDSVPPSQYVSAVGRTRELVRATIVEHNLPGVSVAVGVADTLVWAEGFGWRDVVTRTPVTPDTRFNIGTAAAAITAAVAPLGLTNTGADTAKEWSPEAIGEQGEDFPPLTFLRHVVWQPLGLMPAEYPLADERATFYVPRSENNDPRRGRRLMYMRDLACCANGMAFYSTPSDLVRFALATNADSVNGELAGGMVMSLMTRPDRSIVIAVTSNMAYANTSALARQVADAFAEQR
jgi:hypothetical protein